MEFKKGDRVFLPGDNLHGEIVTVIPKAKGLWAEQFYNIQLDDNPFNITLTEQAIRSEE